MSEVTLNEMLEAKEQRVATQFFLTQKYQLPIICFTMNIAGPIKNSELISRSFLDGCAHIEQQCKFKKIEIVYSNIDAISKTGPTAYYVVKADLFQIKQMTTDLEDYLAMGRLYDMDVIGTNGMKIDRNIVCGKDRNCIVCGKEGRGCASRRIHSVDDLQKATNKILTEGFMSQDSEKIASLASRALIEEVLATPKPGLVDFDNNGSHMDMDIHTFIASSLALKSYFKDCFLCGLNNQNESYEITFKQLRKLGKKAEIDMIEATNGVNTHKGAIFSLGLLCGALGRSYQYSKPCNDPNVLAEHASKLVSSIMDDFKAVNSNGTMIYRQYKIKGIRGEIASGLKSVLNIGLPVYENYLKEGEKNALAYTCMHLIANVEDTNMISRGGIQLAKQIRKEVKEDLKWLDESIMQKWDDIFIEKNLSAGGCADLLAITWFLYQIKSF